MSDHSNVSLPSAIAVLRACFAQPSGARRAERELGLLCAEDALEMLDGLLIDWPAAEARPHWRALRNVPRLAGLTDPAWVRYLDRLGCEQSPARFGPGSSAIVAFVLAEQRIAVIDRLTVSGAYVSAEILSAADYDGLRRL